MIQMLNCASFCSINCVIVGGRSDDDSDDDSNKGDSDSDQDDSDNESEDSGDGDVESGDETKAEELVGSSYQRL